ncbi:hypothetical protein PFISCL1PPCAC_2696 [Pristionchus fissidentatus]|uniref:UPAR/Ly6 domain-containing protein n=1 Tax=Pristionchus fissidentatus TaxID=1538716 RepID=A0AAV5UYF7_9BILA|nr:hypothetical protein PFISCL1PPCAC_2696 [Pristionchus fissidentatus]
MQSAVVLLSLVAVSAAFECWTCNSNRGDDDSKPCHQVRETCEEGVDSCSMVVYNSPRDGKVHTRKFCTSSGTPIYQYLLFFPGSSLCQNINTAGALSPRPPRGEVSRAKRAAPPAPPHSAASSSLLCVCTTPLCNDGTHQDVLERTMLANLNLPTTVTSEEDVHRAGPAPPEPRHFAGKPNSLKPTKNDKSEHTITEPF